MAETYIRVNAVDLMFVGVICPACELEQVFSTQFRPGSTNVIRCPKCEAEIVSADAAVAGSRRLVELAAANCFLLIRTSTED